MMGMHWCWAEKWRRGGAWILVGVILMAALVPGGEVAAIAVKDLWANSQNDILFYDPSGGSGGICNGSSSSTGGNASVSGSVAAEMIWSGLKSFGWSDEAVAGAMGNIQVESHLNPAVHQGTSSSWNTVLSYGNSSGHAVGLVQWDGSRRSSMYNSVIGVNGSMATYLDDPWTYASPAYGCDGDCFISRAGEDVARTLISLELDYLKAEVDGNSAYQRFLNVGTGVAEARQAGALFDDYVECSSESSPCGNGTHGERLNNAQSFYELYHGQSSFGGNSGGDGGGSSMLEQDGTNVTIIGDSITVGAESDLRARGLSAADIHAEVGKHLLMDAAAGSGGDSGSTILDRLIATGNLRELVVIALGTNDVSSSNTGALAQSNFEGIVNKINADGSHQIIFVTNYGTSPYDYTATNNAIAAIKDSNSNVVIADWAAAAARDSSAYISGDHIHPTVAGYAEFADTIYNALASGTNESTNRNYRDQCTSGGGGSGTSSGGVTYTDYNGYTYAFPLAGATKANYLQPTGSAGTSVLSPLRCTNYAPGACHHDYVALDMGLRKSMVDGSEYASSDFSGSGAGYDDYYYYSTGVEVVALVAGTITSYRPYSNGVPSDYVSQCASVSYQGNDGKLYWLGHMSYEPGHSAGDTFQAGDVIGHVGPPPCAQRTQSHLHINIQPSSNNDTYVYDVINALYDALPADAAELAEREAQNSSGSGGNAGSNYTPVFYFQGDSPWGSMPYGNCGAGGTIGAAGCGPTSLASVIATMTNDTSVTPDIIANKAVNAGYRVCGNGSTNNIAYIAQDYGLTVQHHNNMTMEEISSQLRGGKMIQFSVGTSGINQGNGTCRVRFTGGGHFLALRGITSAGKWLIFDSNGGNYLNGTQFSYVEWDPEDVYYCAKLGSSFGWKVIGR